MDDNMFSGNFDFGMMFSAGMRANTRGNKPAEDDDDDQNNIPLTDGGEIDNPLVSKYSDFSYPSNLEDALIHAVGFGHLASKPCGKQVQSQQGVH